MVVPAEIAGQAILAGIARCTDPDEIPAVSAYDQPFAERTPATDGASGWRRQRLSGHSSICGREETGSKVRMKVMSSRAGCARAPHGADFASSVSGIGAGARCCEVQGAVCAVLRH